MENGYRIPIIVFFFWRIICLDRWCYNNAPGVKIEPGRIFASIKCVKNGAEKKKKLIYILVTVRIICKFHWRASGIGFGNWGPLFSQCYIRETIEDCALDLFEYTVWCESQEEL